MKATRLSLWEQNSEIREVFTLWLEALEARGIAPRTLENYREGVGEFVAFPKSRRAGRTGASEGVRVVWG